MSDQNVKNDISWKWHKTRVKWQKSKNIQWRKNRSNNENDITFLKKWHKLVVLKMISSQNLEKKTWANEIVSLIRWCWRIAPLHRRDPILSLFWPNFDPILTRFWPNFNLGSVTETNIKYRGMQFIHGKLSVWHWNTDR